VTGQQKIFIAFLVFFLCFQSTAGIVFAAGKGGFYLLYGSPLNKDYVTGGTVQIDWRDLEPNEGEFHWELFNNTGTYMPWLEVFNARLQDRTPTAQLMPGKAFYDAYNAGKKVRFKLRVTEGAIPLWLYGGEDVNGKKTSSYGTVCAYETEQEGYDHDPHCNSQQDIILAITYPLYPLKEDNSEPVWWNPIFQQKMKNALMAIGSKLRSDPVYSQTVEFVEASVGSYGEMILYGKSDTGKTDSNVQIQFRSAGYTNAVYSQAVLKILGNCTEAFPEFPVALSLGNGLYSGYYDDGSGVTGVEGYVTDHATATWGSRLYLKFAGFGGGGNRRTATFGANCPNKTRCIYESYGGICSWTAGGKSFPFFDVVGGESSSVGIKNLQDVFHTAVVDRAYIVMMWPADWRAIDDARSKCGGDLQNITDAQNAEIRKLEQAFGNEFSNLVALGNIEPTPSAPLATPTPDCPNGGQGNLDCDSSGLIDETDLSILLGSWAPFGPVPTPSGNHHNADLNNDGRIDSNDLSSLLGNWKT
jgi:hypothetical protein